MARLGRTYRRVVYDRPPPLRGQKRAENAAHFDGATTFTARLVAVSPPTSLPAGGTAGLGLAADRLAEPVTVL